MIGFVRIRRLLPVVLLVLAACSNRPAGGALVVTQAPATGAVAEELLVATTRVRDEKGEAMFTGERSSGLDFADLEISIPPDHKAGEIEWPSPLPGDPARQFVARSLAYVDGEAEFKARIVQRLKAMPKGHRDVAVFVHGFNTDFDEGVFRATQIFHDVGFDGLPILFTWASRGRVLDYVYDRDSATAARDGLEKTLRLAAAAGADNIYILAHSMGNWVTVEALRQAAIAGHGDFGGRLASVVLASPDIDVDVFKSEMRRYGRPKVPFFLFISADDKALRLSSLLAGDKPRLGAYTDDKTDIADLGVIVVDLSETGAKADGLNHSKYAAALPEFAARLRDRFKAGNSLTVDRRTLSDVAGDAGGSMGSLVGATAGAMVTLPTYLLTLPLKALGG